MFTPPFLAKARPEPDPHWASVVLCMNMQGLNAAGSFREEKQKIITVVGSSFHTNAAAPFGGTSLIANSGGYLSVPDSSDLFFDTGDVTIEWWFYLNALGSYRRIYSQQTNLSSPQMVVFLRSTDGNKLQFVGINSATVALTGTTSIAQNTWAFGSYSRQGNDHYLHLNGVLEASTSSSISLPDIARIATIGFYSGDNDSGEYWSGYLGPGRITKGVGRYSSGSYTVPKGPFPAFGP